MGIFKANGTPYYQYRFSVEGVQYRGSTGFEKKGDAQAYFDNLKRKTRLGIEDDNVLTLLDAFYKYEEEHAQFLVHYPSVQAHINFFLRHFGENMLLHDVTQNELEKCVGKCRMETYSRKVGGKPIKLSNGAINRRLATFQGMHTKASKSWKVKTSNIDFSALKLKERSTINNTLAKSDVQKLWDAAPDHIRHFIIISLNTGWRMANVLSLTGEQIRLDQGIMQTIGKGGKLITTPITDNLRAYIMANKLHKKAFVCDYKGQPVTRIKTAWNRLFKHTGVKRIRIHDLRHTFGTWLYEQTGDQRLVQELLHHSDIKTSMRYTHTKQELQRGKLNQAINLTVTPDLRQIKNTAKRKR
jgi:integrase